MRKGPSVWIFILWLYCISIDLMHKDVSRLDACEECSTFLAIVTSSNISFYVTLLLSYMSPTICIVLVRYAFVPTQGYVLSYYLQLHAIATLFNTIQTITRN